MFPHRQQNTSILCYSLDFVDDDDMKYIAQEEESTMGTYAWQHTLELHNSFSRHSGNTLSLWKP